MGVGDLSEPSPRRVTSVATAEGRDPESCG